MKPYSFLIEADQINLDNPSENNGFEPLIKSKADIPLSTDQAKKMEIVAKIRQIEAKTKELEASAKAKEAEGMMDPNGMGIDPMTGMPMDPSMQMNGAIDPMTGMPMPGNGAQDPNADPLAGLGDKSAMPDPMGGLGGGIDPMTGMPMPGTGSTYTAIGRAYKLKNIFDSLQKIKNYLRDTADVDLGEFYDDVDTAFEMFKLVINNLKTYKDKVDELIVLYYELINQLLQKIRNTLNEQSGNVEEVITNDEEDTKEDV